MKKIILYLPLVLACNVCFSQGLTQSADGKSSILFKGTSIGLDLSTTQLNFGFNNLYRPVVVKSKDNNYAIYGLNLSVANSEGIGNLFSGGDLVPDGKLYGFLGYSWSNTTLVDYKAQQAKLERLQVEKGKQLFDAFLSFANLDLTSQLNLAGMDTSIPKTDISNTAKDWKDTLPKCTPFKFIKFLKAYDVKGGLKKYRDSLSAHLSKLQSDQDNELQAFSLQMVNLFNLKNETNRLWKFSLFGFGGIEASTFKYEKEIDTLNPSKSFAKTDYRGGSLGFGFNYQRPAWKAGFTYAYRSRDNFDLLDKTDFTVKKEVSANGQTVTQEKKVTAYTGNYGKVEVNELNADLIFRVALDSVIKNNLLINPYVRVTLFSRDKKLIPNTTNIGVGLYFFQKASKFLGGLYIEFPDVANNIEKMKPADEQTLRTGLKRLTFGIVTKISLTTILANQ